MSTKSETINAAADMLDASCAAFADGMGHDNIRDHVAGIRAMAERLRGCAEPDGVMTFVTPAYVGELAAKIKDQAAEIARLTAELAAARAVPADVEAAILGIFDGDGESLDRARTVIARAISDATDVGRREVLDRAKVLATGADVRGKTAVEAAILTYRNAVAEWEHDDPISGSGKDAERRQCDAYIALLATICDATAARGTVRELLGAALDLCATLRTERDAIRADLASERAHLAACRTRIAGLEQAADERSAEVARLTARVAELEARPVLPEPKRRWMRRLA